MRKEAIRAGHAPRERLQIPLNALEFSIWKLIIVVLLVLKIELKPAYR